MESVPDMAEPNVTANGRSEPKERKDDVYTPGPPNAQRVGLWRILAVSLVLSVVGLIIIAMSLG